MRPCTHICKLLVSLLIITLFVSGSATAQEENKQQEVWDTYSEKIIALYERLKESSKQAMNKYSDWVSQEPRAGVWEYKILRMEESSLQEVENALNYLGENGWECFWVERVDSRFRFYLKRFKIEKP